MATSQDRNLMLSVKDFGPIYSAEVELRPLTVFVGPSNTGKSYLAILIYALHKFFSDFTIGADFRTRQIRRSLFHWRSQDLLGKDIAYWVDWANQIISQMKRSEYPEDFRISVPDTIASLIRPVISDVLPSDDLAREIRRCFGIDKTERLIRHGSKESKVALFSEIPASPEASYNCNGNSSLLYQFAIEKEAFTASISETIPFQVSDIQYIKYAESLQKSTDKFTAMLLIDDLFRDFASYVIDPMSSAYYLPADRTGIMHMHKVVIGSLIQGASRLSLHPEGALLSGVVADFLEQLIGLGDLPSIGERLDENLTQRLEKEILSGSILNEKSETGYPVFSYQPTGWKEDLPLMNTSSMVSELAPIVLYLRHVVSPEEVLIIEEPESHLHPGMQVAFIRHLAAAVNSGIRIIITTHSEWVLEELANLVRLSDLPKSRRKGIGGADYALSSDQVGTWLFEPKKRPKGSIVKEMPLDVDYGGFRSDYDDIAIGTHNDWATISNRIEEN